MVLVTILAYGAGNVRSLVNALHSLGHETQLVQQAEDIRRARVLVFPGVGSFAACMTSLREKGWAEPLKEYVCSGGVYFGICLGMQALFEGSEEGHVDGLGIFPGRVVKFSCEDVSVPHMGWNGFKLHRRGSPLKPLEGQSVYFVHSYCVPVPLDVPVDWLEGTSTHGSESFVSIVRRGCTWACQFHPEKSGTVGLNALTLFLQFAEARTSSPSPSSSTTTDGQHDDDVDDTVVTCTKGDLFASQLCKRIVAALDVRRNDDGDLVVTKGDQYDVREKSSDRAVRNHGKPVELAEHYFSEGADEIVFLNITSFRETPLRDFPMLHVLRSASERIFVPLTVGGGIRDLVDGKGVAHSALDVAQSYFEAGADKIAIGSDAVRAAERYYNELQCVGDGTSSIETISHVYGSQAVVISVDALRVYIDECDFDVEGDGDDGAASNFTAAHPKGARFDKRGNRFVCHIDEADEDGRHWVWYQCTIRGGREQRPLDVVRLCEAVEALGAGEIMLNCINRDGTNSGFELALLRCVAQRVRIPLIASSGAGCGQHFVNVFQHSDDAGEDVTIEAALAAGIFHRKEVRICEVKQALLDANIVVRTGATTTHESS